MAMFDYSSEIAVIYEASHCNSVVINYL